MGMLLRLLILAGIVWFIYSFIKRSLASKQTQQPPLTATMHQCRYCGVHIPHNEAVIFEGLVFCSDAHKHLYLQHKP
jgi:uncharacterized protein